MLIVYLVFLSASALALPHADKPFYSEDPRDLEQHFEEFIATYGKQYANEEEKKARFDIFKQKVAKINKRNSDPTETAVFDINERADLTPEELRQRYTGLSLDIERPSFGYEYVPDITVPETFDWRTQKVVTRVKDQDDCGACWAFSAVGAVESAHAIKHKELLELSEQQLVDCDKKDGGCAGGLMQNAIGYIIETGGIEGESDYPYTHKDEKCKFAASKVRTKVSKLLYYNLTNEEDTKRLLVQNGPIAIGIATFDIFDYKKGIMQTCSGGYFDINHGVLLVGYGKEGDTNYWIAKNSWGLTFGENGYFRVKFGKGLNPCAMYNDYAAGAEMV